MKEFFMRVTACLDQRLKGANFTDLPSLRKVPLVTCVHNLLMNEVYLVLTKKYPEARWISE